MRRKLGELLIEAGAATAADVEAALADQAAGEPSRLGDLLLSNGKVTPAGLARALAVQSELPFADLAYVAPEASALIPLEFQRAHRLVLFRLDRDDGRTRVHIALSDPSLTDVVDELKSQLKRPVVIHVAPIDDIESVLAALAGESGGEPVVMGEVLEEEETFLSPEPSFAIPDAPGGFSESSGSEAPPSGDPFDFFGPASGSAPAPFDIAPPPPPAPSAPAPPVVRASPAAAPQAPPVAQASDGFDLGGPQAAPASDLFDLGAPAAAPASDGFGPGPSASDLFDLGAPAAAPASDGFGGPPAASASDLFNLGDPAAAPASDGFGGPPAASASDLFNLGDPAAAPASDGFGGAPAASASDLFNLGEPAAAPVSDEFELGTPTGARASDGFSVSSAAPVSDDLAAPSLAADGLAPGAPSIAPVTRGPERASRSIAPSADGLEQAGLPAVQASGRIDPSAGLESAAAAAKAEREDFLFGDAPASPDVPESWANAVAEPAVTAPSAPVSAPSANAPPDAASSSVTEEDLFGSLDLGAPAEVAPLTTDLADEIGRHDLAPPRQDFVGFSALAAPLGDPAADRFGAHASAPIPVKPEPVPIVAEPPLTATPDAPAPIVAEPPLTATPDPSAPVPEPSSPEAAPILHAEVEPVLEAAVAPAPELDLPNIVPAPLILPILDVSPVSHEPTQKFGGSLTSSEPARIPSFAIPPEVPVEPRRSPVEPMRRPATLGRIALKRVAVNREGVQVALPPEVPAPAPPPAPSPPPPPAAAATTEEQLPDWMRSATDAAPAIPALAPAEPGELTVKLVALLERIETGNLPSGPALSALLRLLVERRVLDDAAVTAALEKL